MLHVGKNKFLQRNVSKTKEMVINFQKTNFIMEKKYIEGHEVYVVENYEYLGVNINNKLDLHAHVSFLISKMNQCINFVTKL